MDREYNTSGGEEESCKIFVMKAQGNRSLGRPRRRWTDNIQIHLREIGWSWMDLIELARDRDQRRALVNTVMSLQVL
jgi:hypothetical protein